MKNVSSSKRYLLFMIALIFGLILAACSTAGGAEPAMEDESMEEMDHTDGEMEDMDHDDDEHEHEESEVKRIPNEGGATITIISPEDGDTFGTLDQVIVDVNVENFELGVDGTHWHVYVDGISFGMVMGGNTDQALPGLEAGEHEISVFLAIGTHEEYQDGDAVTVIVEEE